MLKIFAIIATTILLTKPVEAALLQFNFTGTKVSGLPTGLGTSFGGKGVGETFSGSFTLNTNAILLSESSSIGRYSGDYFGLTLEGYSMNVTLFTVRSDNSYDGFTIQFIDDRTNELGVLSLSSTSDIYSDNRIPTSLNINDFDRTSYIAINDIFTTEQGVINTLNAVVPVPAAAWLFASGLLGLIGVARRKRLA